MRRFFIIILVAFVTVPAVANELMPPHVAKQLGLTQAWMRPINAPYGAQTIASLKLHVHQIDPLEYIEVVEAGNDPEAEETAKQAASEPTDDMEGKISDTKADMVAPARVFGRYEIGRVGMPTREAGRAEAMRLAKNDVRRLIRRGIDATIQTRTVQRVNLYSVATNGILECRDAETGEIAWSVRVGDPRLSYQSLGVDDHYVSVINADKLIKVDVKTGEVLDTLTMRGTPRFGAINTGDFAMIPMIGGSVEGYPLTSENRSPFLRTTAGSSLAMPTKSPDSTLVAWATDRGFVFVTETSGDPSVLFRLKTDGIVSGRLASASGNRFFFGSDNGQVYGLRATRNGEVLWAQSYGEPFYSEPVVVGKQVLISTGYGNLVSFSTETGLPNWNRPIPNIGELIGASGDRLYASSLSEALVVIDLISGTRVGVFPEVVTGRLLVNRLTDRLYLVSRRGEVQCLRPTGRDLPTFASTPESEPPTDEKSKEEQPDTGSPFDIDGDAPDGGDDPFAPVDDSDDPFGGDAGRRFSGRPLV